MLGSGDVMHREGKRQRIASEFDNVKKKTFVESMLRGVAETLASDSMYGHNSANQIRHRVEDIASQLDDNVASHESTSAGRAVLESRFALGRDDSQYMAQAVSLLWAGDGGERLRIVPPAAMPEIMRVASSKGLVRGMASVLAKKRKDVRASLLKSLDLVAWLLQIEEVRNSVFDTMSASEFPFVKDQANQIDVAFKTGNKVGFTHIMSLLDGEGNDVDRHIIVRELLEAVYILVDSSGRPSKTVGKLVAGMSRLVHRVEKDSELVVNIAHAIGGLNNVTLTSDDLGVLNDDATDTTAFTTGADVETTFEYEHVQPNVRQFATSTWEAFRRMTDKENSNVYERAGRSSESADRGKEWHLQQLLSTIWDNESACLTNYEQNLTHTEDRKSKEMTSAIENHLRGVDPICFSAHRSMKYDTDDTKKSSMFPGTEFVSFCVMRGVCGLRGPHQDNDGKEDTLKYNYPEERMRRYSKWSPHTNGTVVKLNNDPALSISAKQNVLYNNSNEVPVDTDFVGRVIAHIGNVDLTNGHSIENARSVQWAPFKNNTRTESLRVNFEDEEAHYVCEAAVYEVMIASLYLNILTDEDESNRKFMRAVAASAKISQLSAMTFVRNHIERVQKKVPTAQGISALRTMRKRVLVTRPCIACLSGNQFDQDLVRLPSDAGIAVFESVDSDAGELFIKKDSSDSLVPMIDTFNRSVPNALLTAWMRNGVKYGWRPHALPLHGQNNFSLMIGRSAQNEPVSTLDFVPAPDAVPELKWLSHMDVEEEAVKCTLSEALNALYNLERMDIEEAYIARLGLLGSEEQEGVFGIDRTIEGASRNRRATIWSDALREVAISGDRLYRFIVTLTGAIGEAADTAVSWEDEELRRLAKEASVRQNALAERVSQFQTKLVESVVTSTLKASNLQLDVRSGNAGDELVVLSSDVKESIRQITSGEAGQGFFESSVELNHLIGTSAKPIKINDVVKKLQAVGLEYQEQLQQSLAVSAPASYSRIAEPRNSFMLHLKPDTSAAIQKSFDHITSELLRCDGYHRHIHLWEFVEGKDWVLTTRFAELVGLMLQYTRMRSGSFASYVGSSQLTTNGHNIRMQIQRLRAQACVYLGNMPCKPDFLQTFGRTIYFDGSLAASNDEKERDKIREKYLQKRAPFGGDDGNDDASDTPDTADATSVWSIKRGIEATRRLTQSAARHRSSLQSKRQMGIEDNSTAGAVRSLHGYVAQVNDREEILRPLGITMQQGCVALTASIQDFVRTIRPEDLPVIAYMVMQFKLMSENGCTNNTAATKVNHDGIGAIHTVRTIQRAYTFDNSQATIKRPQPGSGKIHINLSEATVATAINVQRILFMLCVTFGIPFCDCHKVFKWLPTIKDTLSFDFISAKKLIAERDRWSNYLDNIFIQAQKLGCRPNTMVLVLLSYIFFDRRAILADIQNFVTNALHDLSVYFPGEDSVFADVPPALKAFLDGPGMQSLMKKAKAVYTSTQYYTNVPKESDDPVARMGEEANASDVFNKSDVVFDDGGALYLNLTNSGIGSLNRQMAVAYSLVTMCLGATQPSLRQLVEYTVKDIGINAKGLTSETLLNVQRTFVGAPEEANIVPRFDAEDILSLGPNYTFYDLMTNRSEKIDAFIKGAPLGKWAINEQSIWDRVSAGDTGVAVMKLLDCQLGAAVTCELAAAKIMLAMEHDDKKGFLQFIRYQTNVISLLVGGGRNAVHNALDLQVDNYYDWLVTGISHQLEGLWVDDVLSAVNQTTKEELKRSVNKEISALLGTVATESEIKQIAEYMDKPHEANHILLINFVLNAQQARYLKLTSEDNEVESDWM
jgi:hypothetical protein